MTTPNQQQLSEWMAGELQGEDLVAIERWADAHPDEATTLIGQLDSPMAEMAALESSVEPPHAEFFNSKLQQRIESEVETQVTAPVAKPGMMGRIKWFLAPVAIAGMAVCFFLGTQFHNHEATTGGELAGETPAAVGNVIYVPNVAVTASQTDNEDVTMIVLEGLDPLADDDLMTVSSQDPKGSVRYISKEKRNSTWY